MQSAAFRVLFITLFFARFAASVCAQAFPTNEDLRHFRAISDPRVSPDGRQVLYRITESTADGGRSHLWLSDVESNKARQITFDPTGVKLDSYRGEASGSWMPDGSAILFLAKRGEQTQLYRLSMRAGEAEPFDLKIVPFVPGTPDAIQTSKAPTKPDTDPKALDMAAYEISPDGKLIAVIAEDPESTTEKKQKEDKADANWVDHAVHGSRLFLLDPRTNKLTRLAIPPDVRELAWSDDSSQLLVIAEAPNHASDLGPANKGYLVTVADPGTFVEVKQLPSSVDSPAWSTDGQLILFHAQAEKDAPPGYSDLYELKVSSKAVRNLSMSLSGSIEHEPPIPLAGGGVIQPVAMGVNTMALRIAPNGSPETLKFATPLAGSFHTNRKQSAWAFLGAGSAQMPTLYFTAALDQLPRALAIPALGPANLRAAESKLVRWQNEGFTIEGLLHLPPETSQGKVPLIVDVHGGPSGAWQDGYDPFVGYLVGQGWAVFRPNIRGSSNYGVTFVSANKNDLGGGDYRDLMAGVDYVLKSFPIDSGRLALYGYSYGGEMAGFVEGKTTRFKAIISGAPVIDQYSEYGTESDSWYDRWYFGKPWERVQDAWRQSPLAGAGHASTPFMLLQGESDKTDPLGQSQEMYRALRQMGVPVELVTYPREDHGPLVRAIVGQPAREPWHGFDVRKRIVDFVQKAFAKQD